jgi:DNA-binding response OmpR family regulator
MPFQLAADPPRVRVRSTDQTEEKSMSGRSEKSIPSPEGAAAVLAVSPLSDDRVRLREILSQGNWELHEASDCRGALALLRDQSVPVILCERDHADGDWEDLLKATARLPAAPNLIVFSRLADESLWAEVLNLGGFDVLMKPFEPEEVLRVTFAAWSRWECDFVESAAKEAEAADRTVVFAGTCCHAARPGP